MFAIDNNLSCVVVCLSCLFCTGFSPVGFILKKVFSLKFLSHMHNCYLTISTSCTKGSLYY